MTFIPLPPSGVRHFELPFRNAILDSLPNDQQTLGKPDTYVVSKKGYLFRFLDSKSFDLGKKKII